MTHCATCVSWRTRVPREHASAGHCDHLSLQATTDWNYGCALFAPADAPAPEIVARCPACGHDVFDVLICRKCGERWHP